MKIVVTRIVKAVWTVEYNEEFLKEFEPSDVKEEAMSYALSESDELSDDDWDSVTIKEHYAEVVGD